MALPTELVRFLYAVWFQEPRKSPDQYPAVLGVAISQFLQWDIEAVVRTCSEALEDSNVPELGKALMEHPRAKEWFERKEELLETLL